MARIVVMAAGIDGISQVYELQKELGNEQEIMLIGDSKRCEDRALLRKDNFEQGRC